MESLCLAALHNPGFGSDDYVTFEVMLGGIKEVDLELAVKAAGKLLGGVVCFNDIVSFRDSRCLATLTPARFDVCLSYIAGLAVGYFLNYQERRG